MKIACPRCGQGWSSNTVTGEQEAVEHHRKQATGLDVGSGPSELGKDTCATDG
jgi:hypothetical protein